MLPRYQPETVFTPKPAPPLAKMVKKRIFKPLTLLIPVLITIFLGISYFQIKPFALKCLDQALASKINFKLAFVCSKFSPVPASDAFFRDLERFISAASASGKFTLDSLSQLQSSLNLLNESASNFEGQLQQIPDAQSLKSKIAGFRPLIGKLVQLSPQLSKLLAVNSSASYLVLIQDSTELRSSGGFLDTLAYFTVSNARLTSSRYFSSATLPTQIREANSNPDFPTAAKQISRLFTRSTSLPVDYVVAVNLTTLSTLQKKSISSYLDELSRTGANNLYFSDLVSTLTTQLSGLPPSSQTNIVYFLLSQLQSRQLYIFPSITGWDGSLSPPTCHVDSCLSDFLIPVENHLGLNKASAYLVRSTSLSQSFSPTQIQSEYRLILDNTGSSSVWPAGTVKNYLQVFLPPSSVVDSVNIGHTQSTRPGFLIVSVSFDIPPGQNRELFINYHQPFSAPPPHYRFTYLPQPGLLNTSFTHTINFPKSWSVTAHQNPAVAEPGHLQYNSRTPNPYFLDLDINQ